jgi:hypothetical protein
MINKETDLLVKIYNKIKRKRANDSFDVLFFYITPLLTIINLITYHLILFKDKKIDLENIDALLVNQYGGGLFFILGWILLPLIISIYKRTWETTMLVRILFASFAIFSTLLGNTALFGLCAFTLLVNKTTIMRYIEKNKIYVDIKNLIFLYNITINYSSKNQ